MRAAGLVSEEGYASERAWLEGTIDAALPDAPRRLVNAFVEGPVEHPATVLFSLRPGRAWGWQSAIASSWLAGGRLEGTHGGLDHDSTVGFFISNAPELSRQRPVAAEEALLPLRETWVRGATCRSRREPTVEAVRPAASAARPDPLGPASTAGGAERAGTR
jgi:hypothetical protein